MLNVAVKAARAAGAIINRASLDLDRIGIERKGHNDFVTEVDQAAEAAVIDVLLTAYPGHAILAEESGRERGAKDSEYLWIIDPLDGTTNFIHGFPVYATSIALAFRGRVEQAVVYDPSRNDLFIASKGRGAFLNDKRLRVSKRPRLTEALIGTGFPFRKGDNFKRYLKIFEEVMQQCAGLRRPGAAALDLCYVAAGWYDGFFETGLSPWDIAAGSLMITEAGGLIGNFTGEGDFLYQREIVAGNPKVYAQLVGLLKPYTRMIEASESAPAATDATGAFVAAHAQAAGSASAEAPVHAASAPAGATNAAPETTPAAPPRKPPVRIRKADAEKPPVQKEVAPRRPAARPASTTERATDPSIALREAFSPPEPEPHLPQASETPDTSKTHDAPDAPAEADPVATGRHREDETPPF